MKRIVLIACGSKKLKHKAKASDLYTGHLFKLSLQYARKLKPDAIYILSARHGLLDLDMEIEPYDTSLNTMAVMERWKWANAVFDQLRAKTDIDNDLYIFLAGRMYRDHLFPYVAHREIPLFGLPIGKQLHELQRLLNV